jgi:hypothetical protein
LRVAPDVFWVLLSLPLLVAIGLVPALSLAPQARLERAERTRLLALAATCGLLVNYALGMLLPRLGWVLSVDVAIAVAALAWAAARRRGSLIEMLGMGWLRWVLATAVLLFFAGPILFESLRDWDARSVWFFAAKRLFFGDGLGAGPQDWTLKAYVFSHSDYPKLLPLLGAQFAHAWGVWNEYIPKAGLLILLFPVLLGLLGLPRRLGLSLLFLACVLLLSTKQYLWNGYADTYLCLYACLSTVYLSRWLASSLPLDLALGSAFMGAALNLKNEGSLVVLCIVACLIAWLVLSRAQRAVTGWRSWPAGAWMGLALPWIGFAAWAATKQRWQLANDLELGAGSAQRVLLRLSEGQLGKVIEGAFMHTDAAKSASMFLGALLLAWILRVRVPLIAWYPAAVATLYTAGMLVVYLATPHDVTWHLATSAERTMLLAAFAYLGGTFLVLEAVESASPAVTPLTDQTGLQT